MKLSRVALANGYWLPRVTVREHRSTLFEKKKLSSDTFVCVCVCCRWNFPDWKRPSPPSGGRAWLVIAVKLFHFPSPVNSWERSLGRRRLFSRRAAGSDAQKTHGVLGWSAKPGPAFGMVEARDGWLGTFGPAIRRPAQSGQFPAPWSWTDAKKNRVERSRVVDYQLLRPPLALHLDSCIIILDVTLIFREMSPFWGKVSLITSDLGVGGRGGEEGGGGCWLLPFGERTSRGWPSRNARITLNLALNFCWIICSRFLVAERNLNVPAFRETSCILEGEVRLTIPFGTWQNIPVSGIKRSIKSVIDRFGPPPGRGACDL